MTHATPIDVLDDGERPKFAIEFLGEDHEGRPTWHPFAEITIGEPTLWPTYDSLEDAKAAIPLRKSSDTTRFRIVNVKTGQPAWLNFNPDQPYRP